MAQVKTGISLDADLLEAAEHLAHNLHLSRSGLYARALAEFIERQKSQELLDGLNAAYGERPGPEDEGLLCGISRTMRRVGDPWECVSLCYTRGTSGGVTLVRTTSGLSLCYRKMLPT